MHVRRNLLIIATLVILSSLGLLVYSLNTDMAVLLPKGTIAKQQYDLLMFASLLSLIVIIPVFALTFFIAWRYRASNHKATYKPNWDSSHKLETIWWGIPIVLILILAVITWVTSHSLDPFKPIDSSKKPVKIQVVAMNWKWLFIYPEQNIATVNYLQIPEDTPVNFELTSDAPMNSFWIPQLGGQVYAMSGMSTKLHLQASEPGNYQGVSANLSGEGFSDMKFTARATSSDEFETWVKSVKQGKSKLTYEEYDRLAVPSHNNQPSSYSWQQQGLYDTVIRRYMSPPPSKTEDEHETHNHEGTSHQEGHSH